jgi:transposase
MYFRLHMTQSDIDKIIDENAKLKDENEELKDRIAWFERQVFGSKSERYIPADAAQTELGLEGIPAATPEQSTETITYDRRVARRAAHGREEIPSHLPRKVVEILPEGVDVSNLERIGEKVTEQLEYTPATMFVSKTVRPVFVQVIDGVRTVICAEMPNLANPKGKYGPSLIAYTTVAKFEDHLPIYRLQKQFKRDCNVDIAETSLDALPEIAAFWLDVIARRCAQLVMESGYVQMDESTLRVIIKPAKGKSSTGYIWVRHSPECKVVVFDYHRHRSAEAARKLIGGYKGILQTDGYVVYDEYSNKEGVVHAGCHAHGRRGFEESKSNDKQRAQFVLDLYRDLFAIETEAKAQKMGPEQRLELRKVKSQPIVARLKAWLDDQLPQVKPKSRIGKAIIYCRNRWKSLTRFLEDGRIELSNNGVENRIRPIAVGRKNWMFAGSEKAAERMAVIYTVQGTCALLGINFFDYCHTVLRELPNRTSNSIEDLLPWNWKPSTKTLDEKV